MIYSHGPKPKRFPIVKLRSPNALSFSLRIAGCHGWLSVGFDLWFLWHETFLNSSSFLPLVVKHLFYSRVFRCGEYEYIPYAKKCQGYFSFFWIFFDFFYAALREPAGGCAAGAGSGGFGMTVSFGSGWPVRLRSVAHLGCCLHGA